jgi:predicted membrane channel-forming protein YqfA (hemolysin III family)
MSERRRNEKEEEKREKEDEKRSEKQWEEKWRHNPVRIVSLAIILIWGGIVALIQSADLVTASWWQAWAIFLIGTGVILLVKAAYRLMPEHRRPVGGTIIVGLILIGAGLGSIIGWSFGWPII